VIEIGYISSTDDAYYIDNGYLYDIIEPDLNDYADGLGVDYTFEFVMRSGGGNAETHLEMVEELHNEGIDLIIGAPWSSMAMAALDYINENNILMFSRSSTSPLVAIEDDNLFRMCPDDTQQGPAIAKVIESMGAQAVVVLQRNDTWGDGLYDTFSQAWEAGGGDVYGRVVYDTDASFYTSYLHNVENATALAVQEYGWGNVAILVIGWSECADILNQAQYFPTTYNVTWFGSDGTATYNIVDGAGEHAEHVWLFSTSAAIPDSAAYDSLNDRYIVATDTDMGYYAACTYDIGFIIADAVISTESTDPADVIPVIPAKALARENGITGWCKLNAAGDRYASDYTIWGYGDTGYGTDMHQYGYYDAGTETVTWDTEMLGFVPPG